MKDYRHVVQATKTHHIVRWISLKDDSRIDVFTKAITTALNKIL